MGNGNKGQMILPIYNVLKLNKSYKRDYNVA